MFRRSLSVRLVFGLGLLAAACTFQAPSNGDLAGGANDQPTAIEAPQSPTSPPFTPTSVPPTQDAPSATALLTPSATPGATRLVRLWLDPRIELLSTVIFLSGQDRCRSQRNADTRYHSAVEAHFTHYTDHSAVRLYAELADNGLSCVTSIVMMLQLSNPPDLTIVTPFSEYLLRRAGGEQRFEEFVQALRDFARESQFMDFYKTQAADYAQMADGVRFTLGRYNEVTLLEDYYGMQQHSYNVILAPLLFGTGYSSHQIRDDGAYTAYCIIGRVGARSDMPVFGSSENLAGLIWHEFSHSFVNPLTAQHRDGVNRYAALYEPIAEQMAQQGYSSWETTVNEHIIRAVTTRLAYRELGRQAGDAAFNYELSRSFHSIEPLMQRLEGYEDQRDRYPSFADFYPELLSAFDEVMEETK